jgi:hypothetical protein
MLKKKKQYKNTGKQYKNTISPIVASLLAESMLSADGYRETQVSHLKWLS